MLTITTLGFLFTTIFVITSAKKEENEGIPFIQHFKLSAQALAYVNLLMFFLLASVNIVLIYQIRTKQYGLLSTVLRREQRTLLIILVFYELSYLLQFAWDFYQSKSVENDS